MFLLLDIRCYVDGIIVHMDNGVVVVVVVLVVAGLLFVDCCFWKDDVLTPTKVFLSRYLQLKLWC